MEPRPKNRFTPRPGATYYALSNENGRYEEYFQRTEETSAAIGAAKRRLEELRS